VGVGPKSSSPSTVDVNSADAAALETLPGVGPVLAGRIVAYRDTAGPFLAVDSLLAVPGIGPATLERLRSRVRVR
jgi:competence protein ComEA